MCIIYLGSPKLQLTKMSIGLCGLQLRRTDRFNKKAHQEAGFIRFVLFLFVTIFAKAFLTLVGGDFMSFTFLSARH